MADRLLVFPLGRCVGLARVIAGRLDELNADEANIYWRGEAKRIGDRLLWLGVDAATTSLAIHQLFNAVQAELSGKGAAYSSRERQP